MLLCGPRLTRHLSLRRSPRRMHFHIGCPAANIHHTGNRHLPSTTVHHPTFVGLFIPVAMVDSWSRPFPPRPQIVQRMCMDGFFPCLDLLPHGSPRRLRRPRLLHGLRPLLAHPTCIFHRLDIRCCRRRRRP
jgi:hypothetical protein